jgi:hypothetical protein
MLLPCLPARLTGALLFFTLTESFPAPQHFLFLSPPLRFSLLTLFLHVFSFTE